jgi:hypothetical protein
VPPRAASFVEIACAPAVCRRTDAADRGSAERLLCGHLALPRCALPDTAAVVAPGRVHGLGRFGSREARNALEGALPAALRESLRPQFEWYACRGAFFHNDAHYGEVLFGAWCVSGPPREIVFSRAGIHVPVGPGDWVIFDPFEPHAVLDPGANQYQRAHYESAPLSLFIGFELRLDDGVRRAFGIGPARPGSLVLSSSVAIHAESGAVN